MVVVNILVGRVWIFQRYSYSQLQNSSLPGTQIERQIVRKITQNFAEFGELHSLFFVLLIHK